jgi:hypothetical protein
MTRFEVTLKDDLVYLHTITDAAAHTCAVIEVGDLQEAIVLLSKAQEEAEDSYQPNLQNTAVQ